jgi:hypothetical protein
MRRKIDIDKVLWRQQQNFKAKNWFDSNCAASWPSYRERLQPFENELDAARESLQMPLPETWMDLLTILDAVSSNDPAFVSIRDLIYTERSQYREARV